MFSEYKIILIELYRFRSDSEIGIRLWDRYTENYTGTIGLIYRELYRYYRSNIQRTIQVLEVWYTENYTGTRGLIYRELYRY